MPIAKKMDIPQDFLNQMKVNLSKESSAAPVTENRTNNNPLNTNLQESSTGKKEKYADVLNIRLSKGRRNEIKAFCTNNGVTITQYIESSFEFLAREVAAGNISISKGGISKIAK